MSYISDINEAISTLIKARDTLSPQLNRATEYVLRHPDQVATQSMRKLASKAGVTAPTMSRVAKTLGFETYEEFRDVYRNGYHHIAGGYGHKALGLQDKCATDSDSDLWQALFHANNANLKTLFRTVRPEKLKAVASSLLAADRTFVVGLLSSYSFTSYLHYIARLAMPNWILVSGRGSMLADEIAMIAENDAVLIISFVPYAYGSVQAARLAKSRGAKVVVFTDDIASPLSGSADDIFVLPNESPQYFESYVATVALIEALVAYLVSNGGQDMVRRIEQIEATRETFAEYWSDGA